MVLTFQAQQLTRKLTAEGDIEDVSTAIGYTRRSTVTTCIGIQFMLYGLHQLHKNAVHG